MPFKVGHCYKRRNEKDYRFTYSIPDNWLRKSKVLLKIIECRKTQSQPASSYKLLFEGEVIVDFFFSDPDENKTTSFLVEANNVYKQEEFET